LAPQSPPIRKNADTRNTTAWIEFLNVCPMQLKMLFGIDGALFYNWLVLGVYPFLRLADRTVLLL
jgi:hypothetical protein